MIGATLSRFAAIAVAVACELLIVGDPTVSAVVMCSALLLFWFGWRFGGEDS